MDVPLLVWERIKEQWDKVDRYDNRIKKSDCAIRVWARGEQQICKGDWNSSPSWRDCPAYRYCRNLDDPTTVGWLLELKDFRAFYNKQIERISCQK